MTFTGCSVTICEDVGNEREDNPEDGLVARKDIAAIVGSRPISGHRISDAGQARHLGRAGLVGFSFEDVQE